MVPIMQPLVVRNAEQLPAQSGHGLDRFLEVHAAPVGAALRRAIESLPRRCGSAGELAQRLELDQTSVWRIWQAAYADTLEQSALMFTGETALKRFLAAMEVHGLDPALAEAANRALARFKEGVEREIGDTSTFRTMLAGARGHLGADARYGRLLHDAHRLQLGLECAATLRVHVRLPSQFEGLVDMFSLIHHARLRTLRDQPVVIGLRQILESERPTEKPHPVAVSYEPFAEAPELDRMGIPEGATPVGLIQGASSAAGRQIYSKMVDSSSSVTMLRGGLTGRRGESAVTFGDVVRNYGPTFAHANYWASGTEVCVPTELLVYELHVTDDEYRCGLSPTPQAHQMLYAAELGWGTRLPGDFSGELEHYPPGRPRPGMSEFAAYGAIEAALTDRTGASLPDLHLFRWRVAMPVVAVRYLLYAEGPKG